MADRRTRSAALGALLAAVTVGTLVALPAGAAAAAAHPLAPVPLATDFADVSPGAAFYDEIQWLAAEGITRGAVGPGGESIFGPADSVTREAMAAFIYRSVGEPDFDVPAESPFEDIEPGAAFYTEITWLEAEGIAPADGDGGESLFRPSDVVTREVMALWLFRALAAPGYRAPAVSPFADVPTDHPSFRGISWMAASKISTGAAVGDGTFRYYPSDPIRREAMAAFLFRASSLDTTPPAVPTAVVADPGDTEVVLSWKPVTDPDLAGYVVARGTSATGPWTTLGDAPIVGAAKTADGLANGATYWFTVSAVDALGNASAPSSPPAEATPFRPVAFDLDVDAAADLPAVESASGVLWLHRGDGGGGWRIPFQVTSGWTGLDAITPAGDLDGDGNPDLLAREVATGLLWLYPGNGTGGLADRRQVGWGWQVMSAIVGPGDVDGDGAPDLVAREAPTGALWLYPGDGAGGWKAPVQVGSGWQVMSAIVGPGDVDGDGEPDLVAREALTGGLWLYSGDGAGGWKAPVQVGWGWQVMSAIVGPGDFDGDGFVDLFARDAATGVLWLYPGDGAGGWLAPRLMGPGWGGYRLPGDLSASS